LLFLKGVYVERSDGALPFRWVKARTSAELIGLAQSLAQRIQCFLERHLACMRSVTPLCHLPHRASTVLSNTQKLRHHSLTAEGQPRVGDFLRV